MADFKPFCTGGTKMNAMRNAKIEGLPAAPTLIDRAYEAILSAIREGRLAPGVRLNQDELAATLTISRQPVGPALTILKSQGFLRDNGRRRGVRAPARRAGAHHPQVAGLRARQRPARADRRAARGGLHQVHLSIARGDRSAG